VENPSIAVEGSPFGRKLRQVDKVGGSVFPSRTVLLRAGSRQRDANKGGLRRRLHRLQLAAERQEGLPEDLRDAGLGEVEERADLAQR